MRLLFQGGTIVNEGRAFKGDLLIHNDRIEKIIEGKLDAVPGDIKIIDATGKYIIPGVIDDQVHFREPGLTHKGDIREGSRAAAAGGVTSFMDMPNVKPPTVTNAFLQHLHHCLYVSQLPVLSSLSYTKPLYPIFLSRFP